MNEIYLLCPGALHSADWVWARGRFPWPPAYADQRNL